MSKIYSATSTSQNLFLHWTLAILIEEAVNGVEGIHVESTFSNLLGFIALTSPNATKDELFLTNYANNTSNAGLAIGSMTPRKYLIVLDENGEPLLIYHGTSNGGFYVYVQIKPPRSN